jgi:DNA-binding transcriptional MerR regulator
MRIGEIAERAGVNVETLRYYERRGLLPKPVRSPGGHREYDDDTMRFVRAVKEVQSLGFSLAEIEEYISLTRQQPARASEEGRKRLEAKLEEIDVKLAALRRMRAGVERALYERWDALDRSTSAGAYLARRGGEPVGEPLHVTNGESAAGTLRQTSIDGVVASWDDILHVGPLSFDPADSRRLRAAFFAEHGWGDADILAAEMERRDALLAGASHVVLWFEPDLVDQLQLLQILSQIGPETVVELVQTDEYLGAMDEEQLEALWPARRRLEEATVAAAREAWRRVTEGDVEQDVQGLPHVRHALRRFAEEPERTKRQLLTGLANGPRTAVELFMANQDHEEAVFLGDSWAYLFLYELCEEGKLAPVGGGPMPLPPPKGDAATFASMMLEAR